MKTTFNQLEDLLKSGRFVTITFVKKDGTERKLNGRFGVKRYLKGGKNTTANNADIVTMFDRQKGAYRNVNLSTIKHVSADGKRINL